MHRGWVGWNQEFLFTIRKAELKSDFYVTCPRFGTRLTFRFFVDEQILFACLWRKLPKTESVEVLQFFITVNNLCVEDIQLKIVF